LYLTQPLNCPGSLGIVSFECVFRRIRRNEQFFLFRRRWLCHIYRGHLDLEMKRIR
jgi:hypothetical protein